MSVDIQYPLPSSTVGPNPQAGGTYDTSAPLLTQGPTTQERPNPARKYATETDTGPSYAVICTLCQSDGTQIDQETTAVAAGTGNWGVQFNAPNAVSGGVITAYLQETDDGVVTNGAQDEVDGVTIDPTVGGTVTVGVSPGP